MAFPILFYEFKSRERTVKEETPSKALPDLPIFVVRLVLHDGRKGDRKLHMI